MESRNSNQNYYPKPNGDPNAKAPNADSNHGNSSGTSNKYPRAMRSHSEELGSGDGARSSRRKSSGGNRTRKGVTFNKTHICNGPPVDSVSGLTPVDSGQCSVSAGGFSDVLSATEANGTDDEANRTHRMCLNGEQTNRRGPGVGDDAATESFLQTIEEGTRRAPQKQRKLGTAGGVSFDADQYNDFVNELYTETDSQRPLLPKSNNKPFPKSIVKSTSAANIQNSKTDKKAVNESRGHNRKPRLSLQDPSGRGAATGGDGLSNNLARPHVQFKPEEEQGSVAGVDLKVPQMNNGKSTSFESFTGSEASASSSSSDSSSSSSSSSEDNSSLDEVAEARPPDGGWGWVVVFAAFMVNLFSDGVTFSFGVIYVEFLNYFGESKAKTAWIGSLFMAMPLLSGPIASFLTDRYGCRNVTVVGSIMASAGFILSAFTDSIEMLYFTFGILAGFGLSLCYVAAVVIVAYYFEKRRSFATGLSLCGSGIGTFIFAPVTQLLIENYGWRGSVVILAGIFLNMGVCGLLMRDLEWTVLKRKKMNNQMKEEKARKKALRAKKREKGGSSRNTASDTLSISTNTAVCTNVWNAVVAEDGDVFVGELHGDADRHSSIGDDEESDPRLFSSLIVLPTFLKDGEKVPHEVLESLSTNRHILMMNNYATMPIPTFQGQTKNMPSNADEQKLEGTEDSTTTTPTTISKGSAAKALVPTDNERMLMSIIERNQVRHNHRHKDHRIRSASSAMSKPPTAYLNDMRMHRHSLTYRGAMLNINRYRLRASSCPDIYRNSMTTIAKEKSQLSQGIEEFRNLLLNILDFSHFADIRFVLFAISNFLLYAWYDVPYVYIADYAISFGVNENKASMLLSIVGIVNMFGEVR